jgi:hypothetical protein
MSGPILKLLIRSRYTSSWWSRFSGAGDEWDRMSFAVSVIGRILAGRFKNRDLVGTFGDDYRTYRSKVTMGVPRIGSRKW